MSVTISGTNGIDKVAANSVESGDIASGAVSQTNLAAGVAGNGPAFEAYLGTSQYITSGVYTKVQVNTERYDTANCFDTTTYRFTPNVAGYYQINGKVECGANAGTLVRGNAVIYKNGGAQNWVGSGPYAGVSCTYHESVVTALVYLNGTTDYVELYAEIEGTNPLCGGAAPWTYFSGFLARAA